MFDAGCARAVAGGFVSGIAFFAGSMITCAAVQTGISDTRRTSRRAIYGIPRTVTGRAVRSSAELIAGDFVFAT